MSQFPGMTVLNHGMQEIYDREPQPRTELQKAEARLTRQYGICEAHKRQKKKCTCNIPEHKRVRLPTLAPNEDDRHAANNRDAPIESNNQAISRTEYLRFFLDADGIDTRVLEVLSHRQITFNEARALRMCRLTKDAPTYDDAITELAARLGPDNPIIRSQLRTWELFFEQEEIDAHEACAALHDSDMENFLALARRIKQNSLAEPPERDRSPPSKYCEDLLAQSGFQNEIWEHSSFTSGIMAQQAVSWYHFMFQSILELAMLKLLRLVFGDFFRQIHSSLLGTAALAWKITLTKTYTCGRLGRSLGQHHPGKMVAGLHS